MGRRSPFLFAVARDEQTLATSRSSRPMAAYRSREHLTEREVERLIEARRYDVSSHSPKTSKKSQGNDE
jgi:hypothetical protein